MVGDALLIERKHERVAGELVAKVKKQQSNKTTVTIGGESGSGKSEIAEVMRKELHDEGFLVKILHLDNYYKTSPGSRNDHRQKHGMLAVGLHEINWELLEENIDAFYEETIDILPFLDLHTNQEDKLITNFKNINVLLIEGLYACNYAADINVYIDLSFHKNIRAQHDRKKEKVDLFRIKILEKESKETLKTRPASDYLITPGFSLVKNESRNSHLQKKNIPLISIITINYNNAEVTNQLLASLRKVTWPNIEVIIVDNNSGNDDADLINTKHLNSRLIRNTKNLGFAGGNNAGIAASRGEYILLLNNDTEVSPGFLEPMISLFEKNNKIGAISPKIKFYYRPEIIQYAGFTKMNPFTLRMQGIGYGEMDRGQYEQTRKTEFAHGCAMMVPRRIIDEAGLMPEEYFLYYEEHDWSTTIKRKGYKIYYQPKSVVYHKESMSVQINSPLKTYFINRNRILYMRRNFSLFFKILSSIYLLFISVPKNTLTYLFKQKSDHLSAYWDAIIWHISLKTREQWKF